MAFVSYAQNYEDVMLWRALGHLQAGFYIDLGAFHPDNDSVTRAFYDRGWNGINVEPAPAAWEAMVAARPRDVNLNVAVGRAPGRTIFHVAQEGASGLSTMDARSAARFDGLRVTAELVEMEVETLAAICARHKPSGDIHFLKIDVEGTERAVLEGADFVRWRPWIVLLEATAPMSTEEVHGEWEHLLTAAGYRFTWFDGLNRFYLAAERFEALAVHFRTPANVFDDFVRAKESEWASRFDESERKRKDVQALSERQEAVIDAHEAELRALRARLEAAERVMATERGRAELA